MSFDQKAYVRDWYQENKEDVKARMRANYARNKEAVKARIAKYKEANPARVALYRRRRRARVIKEIFDLLGNKCALCPVEDKHVLQIDHINGGGRKHALSTGWSMQHYYGAILQSIRDGKREYRILCANCNVLECIRMGFRNSIWDFAESFFKDLLPASTHLPSGDA